MNKIATLFFLIAAVLAVSGVRSQESGETPPARRGTGRVYTLEAKPAALRNELTSRAVRSEAKPLAVTPRAVRSEAKPLAVTLRAVRSETEPLAATAREVGHEAKPLVFSSRRETSAPPPLAPSVSVSPVPPVPLVPSVFSRPPATEALHPPPPVDYTAKLAAVKRIGLHLEFPADPGTPVWLAAQRGDRDEVKRLVEGERKAIEDGQRERERHKRRSQHIESPDFPESPDSPDKKRGKAPRNPSNS